jgi:hypothetical protein
MKTASTSLQHSLFAADHARLAADDHVVLPIFYGPRNHNCFVQVHWGNGTHTAASIMPDSINALRRIVKVEMRRRRATILLSSENLAMVTDYSPFQMMAHHLQLGLDYVVVYRRYWSWLVSLHYQLSTKYPERLPTLCDYRPLVSFLSEDNIERYHKSESAGAIVERLRTLRGGAQSFSVLNLHETREPNLPTEFVCHHIHAPRTCRDLRARAAPDPVANEKNKTQQRALEAVRGACDLGLVKPFRLADMAELDELALRIAESAETVARMHNSTQGHFVYPLTCASARIVEVLGKVSLAEEQLVVPGWSSEAELRAALERDAARELFCSVDAGEMFSRPLQWTRVWNRQARRGGGRSNRRQLAVACEVRPDFEREVSERLGRKAPHALSWGLTRSGSRGTQRLAHVGSVTVVRRGK